MSETKTYLTNEQVLSLNEKHGWFQYRDAQSDVSRAFAQDAIEMHERLRSAAPDLLEALQRCVDYGAMTGDESVIEQAIAAISKATGEQQS